MLLGFFDASQRQPYASVRVSDELRQVVHVIRTELPDVNLTMVFVLRVEAGDDTLLLG